MLAHCFSDLGTPTIIALSGEEHTAAIGIVLDMVPAAVSELALTWCQVPMLVGEGEDGMMLGWRTGHIGLAAALRRVDIGNR